MKALNSHAANAIFRSPARAAATVLIIAAAMGAGKGMSCPDRPAALERLSAAGSAQSPPKASGKEERLAMLGDSITLSREAPDGEKLAQHVEKRLNELFAERATWAVINCGKGGETAVGGLGRVDAVLDANKPDFLTISYGLNDLKKHDPQWFERQLTALVEKALQNPGKPQVALLTASPIIDERHQWKNDAFFREGGGVDNFVDRRHNPITRRLAMAKKLPLVDVHRLFLREPGYAKLILPDGVHLKPEGNRLMGRYIAQSLAAFLDAKTPGSKAAEAEKSALAKLEQARKAVRIPARQADARKLLNEALELCPYLAETCVLLDELDEKKTAAKTAEPSALPQPQEKKLQDGETKRTAP